MHSVSLCAKHSPWPLEPAASGHPDWDTVENRYNGGLGHTPDVYMFMQQRLQLQWRVNWARANVDKAGPPVSFLCDRAPRAYADDTLLLGAFSLGTNRPARCAAGSALLRLPSIARLVVPSTGGSVAKTCRDVDALARGKPRGSTLATIAEALRHGVVHNWLLPAAAAVEGALDAGLEGDPPRIGHL